MPSSLFANWYERACDVIAVQVGAWQYRLGQHRGGAYGGPFNGQQFRQRLFVELTARLPFTTIIETGTHRGTTTEFLWHTSGIPTHSFESNPRYHGFAAAKLKGLPDLYLYRCDSRVGLGELAASPVAPRGCVFVYLDAHGAGALPLADEITLVFRHWPAAVVMIDDFAVPDDAGYGYDDFGNGDTLTLEYLAQRTLVPPGIWFPRCAATAETGVRRGCVVLATAPEVIATIEAVSSLRRWDTAKGRACD